ncbi:MAG: hypothetical protein OXG39_09575 [Chloroflexi bacterium]|nr:hypothetical protein [Chloroflexota bacterium]
MALSDIAAGCREAGEAWQSLRESLSLADVSHWVSPLDPPPADPRAARGAG